MSYLWQEFNIKTFPAETLVFRDGVFYEDLSDFPNVKIDKKHIILDKSLNLPLHIIYIGEIAGNFDLDIDINAEKTEIVLDIKAECKKPAFLNIFIKNAGKESQFNGKIIVKNKSELKINVIGQHLSENTGIFVKNRIAAYKNSVSELIGKAMIEKNAINSENDISFSVIADENSKIIMQPTQYIDVAPKKASHSASIYKPSVSEIQYLRHAGLSGSEIKQILEDAFLEA